MTENGVTTPTKQNQQLVEVDWDFKKLLEMQDNWYDFFAIQRYTQLAAPYLFLFCLEFAITGMVGISMFFLSAN